MLSTKHLAPRIKELKERQDKLSQARIHAEADTVLNEVQQVNFKVIKAYIEDLKILLAEASSSDRKAFLRSFIRRITIDGGKATIEYRLPIPPNNKKRQESVLPFIKLGGAEEIRTPDLLRAREALSQLSYSPSRLL